MLVNKEKALQIIKNGDVLIHPTDTVYGISCCYSSLFGYNEIFRLKNRSKNKPLGILLNKSSQIAMFSSISKDKLEPLLPLLEMGVTLIAEIKEDLPSHIKEQSNFIGLRIPNDKRIKDFLSLTGPLISTSANISEQEPISSYKECKKNFNKKIAFLDLENNGCLTQSSIILFKKSQYTLVREGNVNREIVEKEIELFVND